MNLANFNVLLGISGSIAAYKILQLIRLLRHVKVNVRVVMTKSASQFVTPLSIETLSNNPVRSELFDRASENQIDHIELAKWADVILVAPASANTIANLAHGLANDLLSTLILATPAQVFIAPAMNKFMLESNAVQHNIKKLTDHGYFVIDSTEGEQACGDLGLGRMPEADILFAMLSVYLNSGLSNDKYKTPSSVFLKQIQTKFDKSKYKFAASFKPFYSHLELSSNIIGSKLCQEFIDEISPYRNMFQDKEVLITLGGTREPIDTVRYISNHSSGKMGYWLAVVAKELGANVTVIKGASDINLPDDMRVLVVETAAQMHQMVLESLDNVEVFIACAAVADFRVKEFSKMKIKKEQLPEMSITFINNPDILSDVSHLATDRRPKMVVGFAAETEDLEENAKSKLQRKKCDLICANDVYQADQGFNSDYNRVTVFSASEKYDLGYERKEIIAQRIFLVIAKYMAQVKVDNLDFHC